MFSVHDFITKYEQYPDEELVEIYRNKENYSKEVQEALNILIKSKGGLEKLLNDQKEKQILQN